MNKAYLSLGSNMGDKVDYLDKAVDALKKHPDIHSVLSSASYVTSPVGYLDQDDFVNRVLKVETTLTPYALLQVCQDIETHLNRVRTIRWGPRTIDVDILLYNDCIMDHDDLTIPHPRLLERGFVLIPLMEIEPIIHIKNKPIEEWVDDLPPCGVRKL